MTYCKYCLTKKAKYKEFSPDGEEDYFCSEECHKSYKTLMNSRGICWRASPLEKLK